MGSKKWDVVLDGQSHQILVDHGYFSGRRRITVDGVVVLDERPGALDAVRLWNTATEHDFTVEGHAGRIRIDPTVDNMTYKKYLSIDGRDLETGMPTEALPSIAAGRREGKWLTGYGGPIMQPFALAAIVLGQLAAELHSQPALRLAGFAGAGL